MDRMRGAQRHFARVAAVYGRVRNTDPEVVEAIVSGLPRHDNRLEIVDIGCGTGRYSDLLASQLNGDLLMWCCDSSFEMLQECRRRMEVNYPDRPVRYSRVSANNLPFSTDSLDAVATFNAVHHFDLERFIAEAARVLHPGGLLAIYTRTPAQNARNIWGRYFPGFTRHETRLFPRERLERAVIAIPDFQLGEVQEFTHVRIEPTESLLQRARSFHYSTFSLYPPEEFELSLAAFAQRLAEFGNGTIEHSAENTLILARRTDDTTSTTDISP
jgi:SAM-dependent methyltransferase